VNDKRFLKQSPDYDPRRDQTDWARVGELKDGDIEKAIAEDRDAAPILNREWFLSAEVVVPSRKKQLTLRIDDDVVTWFKGHGRGYQSLMNAVLRRYMEAKRDVG